MNWDQNSKYSLESFFQACGSSFPLMLNCENTSKKLVRHRVWAQPYIVVGSGTRVDLGLNDKAVARRHVYLQLIGSRLFAVDLDSETGVFWGNERRKSGWVTPEQSLRIGPYQIELSPDWVEQTRICAKASGKTVLSPLDLIDNPLSSGSQNTLNLPEVTFEFRNEDQEGQGSRGHWVMNRVLTLIGSSKSCHVRLGNTQNQVHPFNAALLLTPNGLWAIDLAGSSGGLAVNGTYVNCIRINDGDHFRLNSYNIKTKIREQGAPRSTSLAIPVAKTASDVHVEQAPVKTTTMPGISALENIDQWIQNQLDLGATASSASPIPTPAPAKTAVSSSSRDQLSSMIDKISDFLILPPTTTTTKPQAETPITPPPQQPITATADSMMLAQQSQFQEMFRQFQHVVKATTDTLKTLQKEQAESFQTEMNEVRNLTSELLQLNSQLPTNRQLSATMLYGPQGALTAPYHPIAGQLPSPQPTPMPMPSFSGSREMTQIPSASLPSLIQVPLYVNNSVNIPASVHETETQMMGENGGDASHVNLYQRISTIQRERQSRLQRLFNILGGSPD